MEHLNGTIRLNEQKKGMKKKTQSDGNGDDKKNKEKNYWINEKPELIL